MSYTTAATTAEITEDEIRTTRSRIADRLIEMQRTANRLGDYPLARLALAAQHRHAVATDPRPTIAERLAAARH